MSSTLPVGITVSMRAGTYRCPQRRAELPAERLRVESRSTGTVVGTTEAEVAGVCLVTVKLATGRVVLCRTKDILCLGG